MIYLFYLYVFLVPFQYIHDKFPKGPVGVNYSNVMILIMILWWVVWRLMHGRRLLMRSPLNLPLIGLLIMGYVGLIVTFKTLPDAFSPYTPASLAVKHYLGFFNGFLLFWLAANMLQTRRRIHWCMLALAAGAPFVFRVFYAQLHSIGSLVHYDDDLRIRGPFSQLGSNELGAFFVYSALMLGLYAFQPKKRWEKLLFFLAAGIYGYGILYSFSRATQLAFGVGLAVVACIKYRFFLVLIVLAALTHTVWLPNSVRERWLETQDESGELDKSSSSRKEFWRLARKLFVEKPIFGHGVGSFIIINPAKMDTHNVYLRYLAEQGIVGFSLFMLIWVLILMMCLRLWRGGPHIFDRYFGFCLMIATLGLMTANFFGDRFTHFVMIGHYWILVGIAARLYANMREVEPLEQEDIYGKPLDEPQPAAVGAPLQVPWPAASSGLRVLRPALNLVQSLAKKPTGAPPNAGGERSNREPWREKSELHIVGRPQGRDEKIKTVGRDESDKIQPVK